MRIELHLILWVTALVSLAVPIFHGNSKSVEVEFPSRDPTVMTVDSKPPDPSGKDEPTADILSRQLPEFDAQARPLFYIKDVASEGTPNVVAAAEPDVLPVLKGIVSSGNDLRGIFFVEADGSYVSAAVGDEVGSLRVVSIQPDRLQMAPAAGKPITLVLRGVGENP